jgi:pimeloyl-ACP methyl ester carboxylesterase
MRLAIALLVVAGVALNPSLAVEAAGQTTISDWKGLDVTAIEGEVDSDGVKIVYHTAGEGPLVVIVHSITGPWFDWRHQIPTLAQRYQVVVMSTRGTDKSDKPVGVEHYTMAKISQDIEAIITHFGQDRAILIGQDSGGFYAWNFAMTHPEMTDRLIAIGSIHPAGLIRELATDPDQQRASMFQRGMQENPNAAENFGERIRNRPARPDDSPELVQLRKDAYNRLYAESIVNFYKANWPRPPFTLDTEGFGFSIDEFPPVQAPTLVIYGENDGAFLPATLNDMWSYIDSDLTVQVLPGVGHGPHTEVPELVTPSVMAWLAAREN